mmetsp:Transcript_57637/g.153983  ORF Transcript_57637/g.153983 Transcript_57637/m.153983 type:complete len:832 (+) Transcript_57637:2-2497(+)
MVFGVRHAGKGCFRRFSTAPTQARVVVIGGGIIGTSVTYHLSKRGYEVLLLERDQLTSGTTWHAAGLMVTFGSTSGTSTELRKYSKQLYQSLEKETGLSTGFQPIGFIELAASADRLEEFRRVAAFNRFCGIEVHEIGPTEVQQLWPLCKTDDVLAGFYVEDDGRVNPVDATRALAKGARQSGAKIIEGERVAGIRVAGGAVAGVTTESGHNISCESVVNCAGMWAREVGAMAGVSVPLQAAEHYYLITSDMPEVESSWPVLEDPSKYGYYRKEGSGLMVGLFEPVAAAWGVDGVPREASFTELTPDWDRIMPFLETAMSRVPASSQAGISRLFCGPESFTPDLQPIVGESPEVRNFFVAAGMNSIGILTGGGMGRLVADWIVDGRPSLDVTGINIDRLQSYQATKDYRRHRVVEALGQVYALHYPFKDLKSARGAKLSPLHGRLLEQGAHFREVSGWESADWYAGKGVTADPGRHTWRKPDWFSKWADEHRACREGVVLIDMSFMSKFLVQGRDAGAVLSRVCTAAPELGRITYTQCLDNEGFLQADITVTQLAGDKFFVVATDTAHRHVEALLKRQIDRSGAAAVVTDVTGGVAQINIQGPRSRELMRMAAPGLWGNEEFCFRDVKTVDIAYAKVQVARITYVGELGYELYVPVEHVVNVYDRLIDVGHSVDLVHAGLKTLGSLRLEKGYRDYGHDIDNTDTIIDAGLAFTCNFGKSGGFIGQAAVLQQKQAGARKRALLQILVKDPDVMLYGAEVVHRNGVAVGEVRSASYGHTLGGAVGLFMAEGGGDVVSKAWCDAEWTVDVAGTDFPAVVSLRSMYDPAGLRVKV